MGESITRYWFRPDYWRYRWASNWRYRWDRVERSTKVALAVALLVVLFGAGLVASGSLSGTSKSYVPAEQLVITKTHYRTVREVVRGEVRIRRVPVIRRVLVKPQTVYEVSTIVMPGDTRTVVHRVTKRVPIVQKRLVTVRGKTQTISTLVTVRSVGTKTPVVTDEHTVTRTVVNTQTVDRPVAQAVTQVKTVTQLADTVTTTVPGPTVTTTVPGPTVTSTVTVTSAGP